MDSQPTRAISDSERLQRLQLIRSENVGPITYFQLLRHYGTAEAALRALPELSRRGGRRKPIRICSRAKAEEEIAATERTGARLIAHGEPDYPAPLAAVEDAPPIISVLGQAHLLERRMVAVVGARNASANGRRFTTRIASEIGAAELVVVSGLARGIDAAAHRGALETGTVAVVAGGVDVPYPKENVELYSEIAERGVIVAEQPVGTIPQSRHFPRRNRLISGLSLGVLVVEAARRSGSLITARLALEQGREVFAVPGSPMDPRAHGTNNLIRQGAALTESADDILAALEGQLRAPLADRRDDPFSPAPALPPNESEIAKAREIVLEGLGPTPIAVDELVRECQVSPALVAAILLELELAGRLDRQPGQRVSLTVD